MSTTPVVFPDNTIAQVPAEKLNGAITEGKGKVAQHMSFQDGTHGWVPLEKVHDVIKSGQGTIAPPPGTPTVQPPVPQGLQPDQPSSNPLTSPAVSDAIGRGADQMNAEAQRQLNMAAGPEAEGRSLLNRAGHAALSAVPATGAGVARVAQGLTNLSPTDTGAIAAGAVDPAVPAAYFGSQAVGSLAGVGDQPSSAQQAVQNPTPDNVQKALFDAAQVAGAGATAAAPQAGAAASAAGDAAGAVKDAAQSKLDAMRTASVKAAMPEETKGLPDQALVGANEVVRGTAPVGSNTRYRANVLVGAGDLADIYRAADKRLDNSKGGIIQPEMRMRTFVDEANKHLTQMYTEERAPQIANHPDAPVEVEVDGDTQAGLTQIMRSAPSDVGKLAAKARRGTITLAEADQLAQGVNKELRSFEKLEAQGQAVQLNAKAKAGMKALDRQLSDKIDDQLRIDGNPGIRDYERRYAAISAVRDQARVRMNSLELQQSATAPLKRLRGAISGGPKGIASASQAAVADVQQGAMLESGLKKLADSGITAKRAVPRPVPPNAIKMPAAAPAPPRSPEGAPLELTPPSGRVPAERQPDLNFNGADVPVYPKQRIRGISNPQE